MKRTSSIPDTIIVGVDIGTTKICVLVAQQVSQGHLEIIGIGKSPSHGLARGVVVDIAPAVASIKAAVKEAELMSGIKIESAYIGISGSHIQARNSQGVVAISMAKSELLILLMLLPQPRRFRSMRVSIFCMYCRSFIPLTASMKFVTRLVCTVCVLRPRFIS